MEKSSKEISRREFISKTGILAGAIGLGQSLGFSSPAQAKLEILASGWDKDLYPVYKNGKYIKKDFSHLSKDKNLGLSKEMIENHLGLYSNYVDNVNKAEGMMAQAQVDDYSLKHLAFSLNGMALHDIYFSNMNTEKTKRSSALDKALEEVFGSFEKYFANLNTIASKVEGWSITAVNLLNGKIFNYGEDTHSSNFPNYVMPILALDVYEHAYAIDFNKDGKAKYLEIFAKIIDWDLVSRRYDAVKKLR